MDQLLEQIAARQAAAWLDSREAEIRAARANGQRAATADLRLLRRRLDDFEAALIGRARAAILGMEGDLAAHERDLQRQIADLERERDDHIGQRAAEAREQRRRVLQALHDTRGPGSARFVRASAAVEEAERDLRTIRADVAGRPLRRQLAHVYLPLMILLAIAEVPVNRLAFELFFQEQPAISLALAGVVGAVLMFFAHVIGTLLRRTEHASGPWQQARRIGAIGLLLAVALTLIAAIAKVRQLYVHLLDSDQGANLSAIVEQMTRGGATEALSSVSNQELGTAGWTLLAMNLVLFVFGITAAFFRHDPHPDYEPAWLRQERARRRLARRRARWERDSAARQTGFDRQLAQLDQLLRETQSKIDDLTARRDQVAPFREQTVKRVAIAVRNRALAFQEGAIAALPQGPLEGDLALVQAASEDTIRARILER